MTNDDPPQAVRGVHGAAGRHGLVRCLLQGVGQINDRGSISNLGIPPRACVRAAAVEGGAKVNLGNCPMCNGNGESWNGNRRCDDCTFWATDFQWTRLCEQAAKARAWDDNRESASHFLTHGLRGPEQLDATLAEERKKGGLK